MTMMRTRGPGLAAILMLLLAGCGRSLPGAIEQAPVPVVPEPVEHACVSGQFCAGAAKAAISPTQEQVDGVDEARLPGTSVIQKFHLGGFGFGPFDASKFLATYSNGALDERTCIGETCLSEPPASRAYHCKDFSIDCAPDSPLAERTWIRAFYLALPGSGDAGTAIIFVTFDAIGSGNIVIGKIKAAVEAATGVTQDNIIVGMTHSHAGADLQGLWGGVPQEWIDGTLVPQAVAAATSAKSRARRATLNYARGNDPAFNNYRRPKIYVEADADPRLSVLQALDGTQVLGTLIQYAAHPTSIGDDSGGEIGRAVHPDYVLGLEDAIEAATGGAIAVFYNGPIADASGSGPTTGDDDYARVRSRGACLARSVLAVLHADAAPCDFSELNRAEVTRATLEPTLTVRHVTATLPVTNPLFLAIGLTESFNRYYDFTPLPLASIPVIGEQLVAAQPNLPQIAPTATSVVSRITIGGGESGLEIVTIPGEATATFGEYIRGLTPNANMMLLGLTHNSWGYIIPEEEFNYIDTSSDAGFVLPFTGYEEFVSMGPLSAPLLRLQAYNPLFDLPATDPRNLPPSATACLTEPAGRACILSHEIAQLDYIQRSYTRTCNENVVGNAPDALKGPAAAFCALLDPQTPLYAPCIASGLPQAACDVFGAPAPP